METQKRIPLKIDDFTIHPPNEDCKFEIEIGELRDHHGYTFLSSDNAYKVALFILNEIHKRGGEDE